MLNSEWAQLINQLSRSRGSHARFFSFVDTISARNYAGTTEPFGWVGLRFQLHPGGPSNEILPIVSVQGLITNDGTPRADLLRLVAQVGIPASSIRQSRRAGAHAFDDKLIHGHRGLNRSSLAWAATVEWVVWLS